ncbi:hypothetical protein [Epilithonimonas vandammei]|uniref:hypothetical protein n=1 Tax=Epilithonimonas vandammei TaxID=2487072 RepID=UPI001E577F69|nr:hypothetical protein [Epilithonimonas vandammei]
MKINFTILFTVCFISLNAQTVQYDDVYFNNLYLRGVYGNANEQKNYHISTTSEGTGGSPLLDVKWWGGIRMHSQGGAVRLKSSAATLYMSMGGNTRINNEDPQATLDVRGNARINSNSEYSSLIIGQQSNDNIIADNTTGKMYGGGYFFRVHNDNVPNQYFDALIIDENGNVGIGSKPAARLDVNGSFRVTSKGNSFGYDGVADLILRAPERGSGGRAIVHDEVNVLAINYAGDFSGGTKIGNKVFIKNDGNGSFEGKIEAREIKVTQTPTADFVFEETYHLPTLESVERHIKEKKHLPEIASAELMEKEGVNVGEFQIKLLQKIEELTLYVIEQNRQINTLKQNNELLQMQINQLLNSQKINK